MSLADHWSEGNGGGSGSYLPEGIHDVTVIDNRTFNANSGNKGVEFIVRNDLGLTCKTDSFWLIPTQAQKDKGVDPQRRLAGFVNACGLAREECENYDPLLPQNHSRMNGKRVRVTVENDANGYSVAVRWERVTEDTQPEQQSYQHDIPNDDDLPQRNTAPPIAEDDIPF